MRYFKPRSEVPKFTPFEVHHYWHGMITMGLAFILLIWSIPLAVILFIISLWVIVDDLIQHILHKKGKKLASFWHWFPYKVLDWIKKNV